MKNVPVVIITGASRGLGAAVARWTVRTGAALSIVARSQAALEQKAAELSPPDGRVLALTADVADSTACEQVVAKTVERFGRIDAVVNNAGIIAPLDYTVRADPNQWRYNLEVNLMGPFYLIRSALGELKQAKGRIINVSSGAATTAIEAAGAYCAAKAALNHFTRVIAAEEPDITAVAIRPGVVDTDMQKILRDEGAKVMPSKWAHKYRDLKANDQLEPLEIPARVIAWLALNAPTGLSGQFINYDDPLVAEPALNFFSNSSP